MARAASIWWPARDERARWRPGRTGKADSHLNGKAGRKQDMAQALAGCPVGDKLARGVVQELASVLCGRACWLAAGEGRREDGQIQKWRGNWSVRYGAFRASVA